MNKLLSQLRGVQIIEVLSNPPFFSFTLSVIFSQIAFNMLNVVLIFQIFHLTTSNFAVSMLILTYLLPQIFLSFLGGIVADVRNKKKILLFGNFFRALALVILFFNFNSITIIYTVSLIVSIITQFYVPAETPMIPHLVKKNHLVGANSIFGMGLFGSILVSYVLAGPAITLLGRSQVFIILAFMFVVAAFFAYLIPDSVLHKHVGPPSTYNFRKLRSSFQEQLKESFLMLQKTRRVAGAFFLLIISQAIVLMLASVVPGYAKGILKVPAEDLSVLLFAPAALGMIIASFVISNTNKERTRELLMTHGIFISGIVLLLFPFISGFISKPYIAPFNHYLPGFLDLTTLHLVNVLAFFAGVGNAMIFIPSQTIIQESTPENFQSKIYGLLFAMIGVFSLVPVILTGSLADIVGVETVLVLLGVAVLLIGVYRTNIPILLSYFKR